MSEDRRPNGMSQVGDVLTAVINPLRDLREIRGRANTVFHMGLTHLRARASRLGLSAEAIDGVEERALTAVKKGLPLCESPIECMALAALVTLDWPQFLTIPPIVHNARADATLQEGDLLIVPQMAMLRHRLDFGVVANINGYRRVIGIECDGEAYHQDAERERARDRYMRSWDIPVFHLTGSEINADANGALRPIAIQFAEWCMADGPQFAAEDAA